MSTKKIVLITWAASIITKIIYVFIVINFGENGLSESVPNILNVIGAIALASAILSYYLSSARYRSTKIYKSKFFNSQISNSTSKKSSTEIIYMLISIFSVAFTENVALFGFVGFILSSNIKFFISLMLVSIILWGLSYPRHDKFEEIKEKLKTEI